LNSNTSGVSNTAIGCLALYSNTTGSNNTAIGYTALYLNTTGVNNTAIGCGALTSNTIGVNNTAIGYSALCLNTTGVNNTAIGCGTLYSNTTGFNNIALGSLSGCAITVGSCNVVLGGYTGLGSPINQTGNGYIVLSDGFGTVRNWIDNTGIMTNCGDFRTCGNIAAFYTSDCRLKTNIQPIANAMCKLTQIRGVSYDWTEEYIKQQGGEHETFMRKRDIGLIAQEVEAILPEIVATRDNGFKALKYERVVALLVEAVKEINTELQALKSVISKG
jgi:hypothetical protein